MSRPVKCRRVDALPGITYLKPAGIQLRDLQEICLSIEEIEAVRLKDLEGLEQEQGAERMNISRPTFQRILSSARQKIADALVNGKAMRIEGGNYEIAPCRYRCASGHEWSLPYEEAKNEPPKCCPDCSSTEINLVQTDLGKCCRLTGRRRCCRKDANWQKADSAEN